MRARLSAYAGYVALAGLVCLVVAGGAWLVAGRAALWIEVLGAVGLVCEAATILLVPRRVKELLTGRQARYGGNAVLISVAFLLILALVNVLGARHHKRWDVTAEKQFSLSAETLKVLGTLKEPVHVKAFFTAGAYGRQETDDLLKEYVAHTNKLTYEFIDPDAQRRLALDYGVARDGTIVFERGTRREVSFAYQEQDLTSALLKVISDKPKQVYFLTGHQERDIESSGASSQSLSLIKQTLERENYQVATLNLAVTNTVPADASVLIIAGPKLPYTPTETQRLSEFVDRGGSLLIMVEAGMADPFGGWLSTYGLGLPDSLIVDPQKSLAGDIGTPLVDHYQFHQITKDMTGWTSFFPTARAITLTEPAPEGWMVQTLAQTSNASWAETKYRDQQVKQDPGEAQGPLGLMVAVEPSGTGTGKGRLVVFGDVDFVADGPLTAVQGQVGNVDLFMNSVGWLAAEQSLISIRPKDTTQRQVILSEPQARAIIYSDILFIPLLVLAAGAYVWWKRR